MGRLMRFTETGPDIPSHLLNQQMQGNVVFFCGAGVSMPAGLDSFWQLTDRIVTALDATPARKRLDEGWDFDRIFYLLERDFDRSEIDREIFKALGKIRAKTLANHRAILSLSKGAAGSTQLVTTNFDTLFERAGCKGPLIVPPNLPDLNINRAVDGLVYLHGRLADPERGELPSYVISSADFGRAYLAEGWATRFVKDLRERHTLVFLGYSAEDPPMRYLLEGLNNRKGVVYDNPVYAFAPGGDQSVLEAWQDRGVTPIEYDASDRHANLWSTIHQWAAAAEDPEQWAQSLVAKAQRGPRALLPYERGQVVELVGSSRGAAAFANADPSITSEWLSVFDPNARYGQPKSTGWGDDAEEVDPLELYGLDSDTPRPPKSTNRLYDEHVENPLAPKTDDETQAGVPTLHGQMTPYRLPLSPRMHHLARWFGEVSHEPPAVWWASGWKGLSPHLLWFVARRLRDRHGEKYPDEARHFWALYLEHAETQTFDEAEFRWFEFEGLVKTMGWNGQSLRYLERCLQPTVVAERPYIGAVWPTERDWAKVNLRNVVQLKVRVLDRHNTDLKIPDENLPQVVRIIRNSLIRMVELLDETGDFFWRCPNLHPTGKPGESNYGRKNQLVLWYRALFRRLVELDPTLALDEYRQWPKDEERLFAALRVWAATNEGFLSDVQALDLLHELSDQEFWSSDNQRGVMLLIKQIWPSSGSRQRGSLEKRLIAGPPRWDHQTDEEYRLRSAAHAASRLRWMELNDCELSTKAQKALTNLKTVDPRWSDEWAKSADDSMGSKGGMIHEIRDAQGLESVAIDKVLDAAEALSTEDLAELREFKPFKGLVENHPSRALSALRRALKDDEFPVRRWIDLLSCWPARTPLRLKLLLAYTIVGLSADRALELRYYSTDWLKANIKALYRHRGSRGLEIFDGFLRPFETADPSKTKSSLGQTSTGGEVVVTSEVSNAKAINSPLGKLAEALWSLTPRKAKKRGRPGRQFESRFERLISVPGDGAGHAVTILTKRLGWIVHCYEDWANEFLIPLFDIKGNHAEAAWHGLIYDQNPLPREIWDRLRGSFKIALKGATEWPFDKEARKSLVDALVFLSDPTLEDGAIFDFAEVRSVLKELDQETRAHALWTLGNAISRRKNWTNFGKPFVEEAWPREKSFRSQEVTRGFLRIVDCSGEHFPDAVHTVKRFLLPVPHADTFTYRLSKELDDEESQALKHPEEALELLNAISGDDRASLPYGLRESLLALSTKNPTLREREDYRRLKALVE